MGALKLNPCFMEAHIGAGQALCKPKNYAHGTVFCSFVVKKSSYAREVKYLLKSTSDLDKTLETNQVICAPPKDEVAVAAMLELASAFSVLGDLSSIEKLSEVVLKTHPENEKARKIREDPRERLKLTRYLC
ncbi:hypothetical protein R1flu_013361 [Riccia fluitans]|uniref:Uncharacterized protein n=1 Tax=Riccia fluitans TaxID=41844 RepID=A0ABD1YDS8_9MARC